MLNLFIYTVQILLLYFTFQLPIQAFRVDQLPMSDTVMGIWSSLVRLAGSGEGVLPAVFSTLAQSHVLLGPPTKSAKRSNNVEGWYRMLFNLIIQNSY